MSYLLEVCTTTEDLVVKSPSRVRLICIFVSLKLKNKVNNWPYLSNILMESHNILMVVAYDIT